MNRFQRKLLSAFCPHDLHRRGYFISQKWEWDKRFHVLLTSFCTFKPVSVVCLSGAEATHTNFTASWQKLLKVHFLVNHVAKSRRLFEGNSACITIFFLCFSVERLCQFVTIASCMRWNFILFLQVAKELLCHFQTAFSPGFLSIDVRISTSVHRNSLNILRCVLSRSKLGRREAI